MVLYCCSIWEYLLFMKCWKIYALIDPREPNTYIYIGQTRQGLQKRLSQHEYNGVQAIKAWVHTLHQSGVRPKIIQLDECYTQEEADQKECEHVTRYSNLLNTQPIFGYSPKQLKYTPPKRILSSSGHEFQTMADAGKYYGVSSLRIKRAVADGRIYPELNGDRLRYADQPDFTSPKFRVLSFDGKTDTIHPDLNAAAEYTGISTKQISEKINDHRSVSGIYFFHLNLNTRGRVLLGNMKKVLSDDDHRCFLSISDAAKYYHISRKQIYASINRGYDIVRLGIRFWYLDSTPQPPTVRQKGGGWCAKRVRDSLGNKFDSLKEAANFHKVKVDTIAKYVKTGNMLKKTGCFFYYGPN